MPAQSRLSVRSGHRTGNTTTSPTSQTSAPPPTTTSAQSTTPNQSPTPSKIQIPNQLGSFPKLQTTEADKATAALQKLPQLKDATVGVYGPSPNDAAYILIVAQEQGFQAKGSLDQEVDEFIKGSGGKVDPNQVVSKQANNVPFKCGPVTLSGQP